MIGELVKVVLPLPARRLSPNCPCGSKGGRIARAVTAKSYRKKAKAEVDSQVIGDLGWEKAIVSTTFFHATDRRRDDINSLAMMKSAIDGVVDSGLLLDDDHKHLTTLPAKFDVDKEYPRVEMVFERVI